MGIPHYNANTPDVVNRTFGNRTQSNPIARLGAVIELNRTHKKILPIERNGMFGNRTVQQSNIIELNRTYSNTNNQKHEAVSSGLKQSVAVK